MPPAGAQNRLRGGAAGRARGRVSRGEGLPGTKSGEPLVVAAVSTTQISSPHAEGPGGYRIGADRPCRHRRRAAQMFQPRANDPHVLRESAMILGNAQPIPFEPRRSTGIDSVEALRLLGSVSFGRVVFTQQALPTIRPVNHVLADGDIVIRTHAGAALTARTRQARDLGVVVAYEADDID